MVNYKGFRFALCTTGLSTLNCSNAIENAPACNTNKARISPYSTLKYNTSTAITLSCSLTNQRARSCRASTPASRVQNPAPVYK